MGSRSALALSLVVLVGCTAAPYVPGRPHPTPEHISALARVTDAAKALQALVPFSIRLTPSIALVGQSMWVRCYVPWSMGEGRIRYGIPGIRESEEPLAGAEYRLLVERIGCGRWTARCLVRTKAGIEQREQTFDTAGCGDNGEIDR